MIRQVDRHELLERMGEQMKVDPAELRTLASWMDSVATAMGGLQVKTSVSAATAMPGSPLGALTDTAVAQVEEAWSRMASRCTRVSAAAEGTASNFEVTDEEFARNLKAMGD
ncbi:type VII secretion target [Nocardia goodfellowii]